jgi:hypothetical protein
MLPTVAAATVLTQLAHRAVERFDFALVVDLLSFGEFQRFEHFLHFIENVFEFLDDFGDLIDGVGDAGSLELLNGLRMRLWPGFRLRTLGTFLALRSLGAFGTVLPRRTFRTGIGLAFGTLFASRLF